MFSAVLWSGNEAFQLTTTLFWDRTFLLASLVLGKRRSPPLSQSSQGSYLPNPVTSIYSLLELSGFEPFWDQVISHFLEMEVNVDNFRSVECSVISPLKVLYFSTQSVDVRVGSLKILLHVLERYGQKLHYSWPNILEMLRLALLFP
ncbi:hypothetical protein GLYMA_08G365650v4 [Glycine max]|nr:hypothetical protein GLYMA_08G365650v4 [Glycine max]